MDKAFSEQSINCRCVFKSKSELIVTYNPLSKCIEFPALFLFRGKIERHAESKLYPTRIMHMTIVSFVCRLGPYHPGVLVPARMQLWLCWSCIYRIILPTYLIYIDAHNLSFGIPSLTLYLFCFIICLHVCSYVGRKLVILVLLAHLSRRLIGELIDSQVSVVRPSVVIRRRRQHFQTTSPLKPWNRFLPYFTYSIYRQGQRIIWVFFCPNRIRTLIAMATFCCHWFIMGKNEHCHLLLSHCRYFDKSFTEMFLEWSSTKHTFFVVTS